MIKADEFQVVVIGELNVDLIMNRVEKFPEMGKEALARAMTLTMGSSSAIFASNLSTLGTKVMFVGRTGADSFGELVVNSLRSHGVDTNHIIRSADVATGASIVLNYDEDRAMVTYPGAMEKLTLRDIPVESLLKARHLHMSSLFLQSGLRPDIVKLFSSAKSKGLTTSIDPQWDPAEEWNVDLAALLPHVDLFLPNLEELLQLTKSSSMIDALEKIRKFANRVVVKCGSDGAYLYHKGSLLHQPSFENRNVVDSIGAGDSFDAGLIHYFIEGRSDLECMEFGAVTGAINTTRAGGTGAFESLDAIKAIAKQSFNYSF